MFNIIQGGVARSVHWVRKNLFSTPLNGALTLLIVIFLVKILQAFLPWGVRADWRVIPANLKLILTGAYPVEELWRIWAVLITFAFLAHLSFGCFGGRPGKMSFVLWTGPLLLALLPFRGANRAALVILTICQSGGWFVGFRFSRGNAAKRGVVCGWFSWFVVMILLINGVTGPAGFLPRVPTNYWGGLFLSLIIAGATILVSFPLGLLLALGRRSKLPVFRWFSVAVIELIRGVPLITLLFLGYLILPMALPEKVRPDVLIRAVAGIILFHSAYMAENIRGGFQGVPKTQFEAAYAMGFNNLQSLFLVILPQVIKNIIPILVSSFTSMLKDTSLISIIGLLDLIGISTAIGANPDFMKDSQQVILFMSLIYFILCFAISNASRKIEARYKN